jgi:hypothetical protein
VWQCPQWKYTLTLVEICFEIAVTILKIIMQQLSPFLGLQVAASSHHGELEDANHYRRRQIVVAACDIHIHHQAFGAETV